MVNSNKTYKIRRKINDTLFDVKELQKGVFVTIEPGCNYSFLRGEIEIIKLT